MGGILLVHFFQTFSICKICCTFVKETRYHNLLKHFVNAWSGMLSLMLTSSNLIENPLQKLFRQQLFYRESYYRPNYLQIFFSSHHRTASLHSTTFTPIYNSRLITLHYTRFFLSKNNLQFFHHEDPAKKNQYTKKLTSNWIFDIIRTVLI